MICQLQCDAGQHNHWPLFIDALIQKQQVLIVFNSLLSKQTVMLFGNFQNWLFIGGFPSFPCSSHQVWIEWLISTKFDKDRVSKILSFSKSCQNRQLAEDRDRFVSFLREKLKYLSNLIIQKRIHSVTYLQCSPGLESKPKILETSSFYW